jgi:hypothetical protein
MHLMGVHLLSYRGTTDDFTKRFVCEVTPHANSPSPELALEIAPLIHSDSLGLGQLPCFYMVHQKGNGDLALRMATIGV